MLGFPAHTTLARLDSSIEKDILIWEMENSKEEDRFFICRIRKTLQKYNLPSPALFNIYFPVFLVSYSKVLN
jgi:hypothetical protein